MLQSLEALQEGCVAFGLIGCLCQIQQAQDGNACCYCRHHHGFGLQLGLRCATGNFQFLDGSSKYFRWCALCARCRNWKLDETNVGQGKGSDALRSGRHMVLLARTERRSEADKADVSHEGRCGPPFLITSVASVMGCITKARKTAIHGKEDPHLCPDGAKLGPS